MEVEDTSETATKPEEESKVEEKDSKVVDNDSTDVEQAETSINEDTAEEENEISFKKPLIGPKKGTAGIPHKFKPSNKLEEEGPKAPSVKKSSTIPALQAYADPNKSKEKLIPLPYTEPEWGGNISNEDYSLEVLKDGVIAEKILLNTKSFYIFGRLSNCDVQMNHPSSSRYHAILQYRLQPTEKSSKGFYIYDLGSTHGTFLNKNRIKSKVYAPIKVGQFFKIGGSSRLLILQVR
jgi:protein phosphatase 1D